VRFSCVNTRTNQSILQVPSLGSRPRWILHQDAVDKNLQPRKAEIEGVHTRCEAMLEQALGGKASMETSGLCSMTGGRPRRGTGLCPDRRGPGDVIRSMSTCLRAGCGPTGGHRGGGRLLVSESCW
jgi:hypothetical protein